MNDNTSNDSSKAMPVPRSELETALQCIHQTITNGIDLVARHDEDDESKQTSESPSLLLSSLSQLKQEMFESLDSAIRECVQPIDEQEYYQKSIYNTPMKRDIQNAENDEDDMSLDYNSDSNCESFSGDDESEDEDDEDFLDRVTLQRAKELREKVRQKAAETKAIKEAKLSILMEKVTAELEEWKKLDHEQSLQGHVRSDDNNDVIEENRSDRIHERLQTMSQSLLLLDSTLKAIDMELPEKLESLQQTTETILHYIQKKEREIKDNTATDYDTNQKKGLSRVERAILSRVDINKPHASQKGAGMNELKSFTNSKLNTMNAEQRFALFVSQAESPWDL